MSLLEVESLTKQFGGLVAVDGVSCTIREGEVVGLIGPNGAGKTTLFRTIAGEYAPTAGDVRFRGESIAGQPTHAVCRAGLVKTHQVVRPFDGMTVRENVAVGASFGGGDADDADARTDEMLSFVGLEDVASRTPDELGIGTLKRLEIARTLATDPDLLLLDEVAGGLSAEAVSEVVDLIQDVNERGYTIFLIDHVLRALMSVSERVFVLDDGRLIAKGTPREIQSNEAVIEAYLGEGFDVDGGRAGRDA